MPKNEIAIEVMRTIKERKIKPIPKWIFRLKKYSILVFFGVFSALASVSFSVIFYNLAVLKKGLIDNFNLSYAEILQNSFPYFWLALGVCFLLLGYFNFRSTEWAYRFRVGRSFGGIALIVLGMSFAFLNLKNGASPNIRSHAVVCRALKGGINVQTGYPRKEYLYGKIIRVIDDKTFSFKDCRGRTWNIMTKKDLGGNSSLQVGKNILIMGVRLDKSTFQILYMRLEK